ERPLTRPGEQRARAVAGGLHSLLTNQRINNLLTSPLLRARQTAEILAGYLNDPPVDETEALAPTATMENMDTCLHEHFGMQCVALVGHEPNLSRWISWSLTRRRDRLL